MVVPLLARLSGLLGDVLAEVPDALALVGLGLADLADVGGDLADRLLVDAPDHYAVRSGHLEGDAGGGVDGHGMAEAKRERSEERSVGKEWGRTVECRGAPG